jgi:hypothetical protein
MRWSSERGVHLLLVRRAFTRREVCANCRTHARRDLAFAWTGRSSKDATSECTRGIPSACNEAHEWSESSGSGRPEKV